MRAPVVIFTYNRYEHTKKTIEALAHNRYADETEVFVYVDCMESDQKRETCKELYNFLAEQNWKNSFLNVQVIYAQKHRGLARAVIYGVSQVVNRYGKVIVLEDDIVTNDSFLGFMNDCLDYYELDERIWSISGYAIPSSRLYKMQESVYLAYRASSWGWATWKDRWDTIDWEIDDYRTFKYNIFKRFKFNRGGKDLAFMLDCQMDGLSDSWAVRWCYSQSKQGKYTVYPVRTYLTNIGMDGSGTHFSSAYCIAETEQANEEYRLQPLKLKSVFLREQYRWHSGNTIQCIKKSFLVLAYHTHVLNGILKLKAHMRGAGRKKNSS